MPPQSVFLHIPQQKIALIQVTNDLTSTDAGALNILILLDFSVAFDPVSHRLLTSELQLFGVEGTALSLIQSSHKQTSIHIT